MKRKLRLTVVMTIIRYFPKIFLRLLRLVCSMNPNSVWGKLFQSLFYTVYNAQIFALWTFQVKLQANDMELTFPHQLFIANEFIDASDGSTFNSINPTDESVSNCHNAVHVHLLIKAHTIKCLLNIMTYVTVVNLTWSIMRVYINKSCL